VVDRFSALRVVPLGTESWKRSKYWRACVGDVISLSDGVVDVADGDFEQVVIRLAGLSFSFSFSFSFPFSSSLSLVALALCDVFCGAGAFCEVGVGVAPGNSDCRICSVLWGFCGCISVWCSYFLICMYCISVIVYGTSGFRRPGERKAGVLVGVPRGSEKSRFSIPDPYSNKP